MQVVNIALDLSVCFSQRLQEPAVIGQARAEIRAIVSCSSLEFDQDLQAAAVKRLGLLEPDGGLQQQRKVVEVSRRVGVVRPVGRLVDPQARRIAALPRLAMLRSVKVTIANNRTITSPTAAPRLPPSSRWPQTHSRGRFTDHPDRSVRHRDPRTRPVQSAELSTGTDVRLASGVEAAQGRGAPLYPRTSDSRGFRDQHRVGQSVLDVDEPRHSVVSENAGASIVLRQERGICPEPGDADVRSRLRQSSRDRSRGGTIPHANPGARNRVIGSRMVPAPA